MPPIEVSLHPGYGSNVSAHLFSPLFFLACMLSIFTGEEVNKCLATCRLRQVNMAMIDKLDVCVALSNKVNLNFYH